MNIIHVGIVAIVMAVFIATILECFDILKNEQKDYEDISINYKFDGEKWVSNDLETNKILADCIYYILDYMAKEGVVDEENFIEEMMKLMDEIAQEGGVILKQNGGKNGGRR